MRIVFAGTPKFAVPALVALAGSRHELCLVVTQPDRPAGRGRKMIPPSVKEVALAKSLPVIQPESINRPESLMRIGSLKPDALLVVAYGKRLTRRILDLPKQGVFNIHASLLPEYRGASPIAHAILHGESRTGITFQKVALEIDSGPILFQHEVEIGEDETAAELTERLAALSGETVVSVFDALEAGTLKAQAQDERQATYAPCLTKDSGLLRWAASAQEICCRIRAMTPWPGVFTYLRDVSGEERGRLILLAAKPLSDDARPPIPAGTIVQAGDRLVVAAGTGFVSVFRLQQPGRKPLDAAAFMRGRPIQVGDRFCGPP